MLYEFSYTCNGKYSVVIAIDTPIHHTLKSSCISQLDFEIQILIIFNIFQVPVESDHSDNERENDENDEENM